MAKKATSKDTTRLKAQEMRQAQANKEKKTRAIIFAVVGALVAVTIIAVIWVVTRSGDSQGSGIEGSGAGTATPMVVSAKGAGVEDSSLPTLQEYFDYSCHACADMEVGVGPGIWDAVNNGEINLELIPVNVVKMPWQYPAVHAAYLIYENEPEKFEDFHHETHTFFQSQFNAGDASIIQDEAKSLEKIKEIATSVGVSDDLVAQITADGANSVIENNTQAWSSADIEGREGLGTPEYVTNGKHINFSGNSMEEVADSILNQVKENASK